MRTLVLDVGGTSVKLLATGETVERKFLSGPTMTPEQMAAGVLQTAEGWQYDQVTVGFPGPVVRNRLVSEPHNLGRGWLTFNFEAALGCPTKLINDAAMQALGSYEGGKMLFLGLGTGLGSAMIVDNIIEPMEISHLPYRKRTFEDYVGLRGLDRYGKKKWRALVEDVIAKLDAALEPDYIVIGGGNSRKLKQLPPKCRLGDNTNAFAGGFRLWEEGFHNVPATPLNVGPHPADSSEKTSVPQENRSSAMTTGASALTRSPAWQKLAAHYEQIGNVHLRQLFADDPGRGQRLTLEALGIYLDYSKNRVTDETLKLLVELARQSGLSARMEAMFRGDKINVTERRAVLHVALRAPVDAIIMVDGQNVVPRGACGARPHDRLFRSRAQRRVEGVYRQADSQRGQHRHRRLGSGSGDGL